MPGARAQDDAVKEEDGAQDEPSSTARDRAAAAVAAQVSQAVMSTDGFAAASKFEGAKVGFVFKQGGAGLGYYPDRPLANLLSSGAVAGAPMASERPGAQADEQE